MTVLVVLAAACGTTSGERSSRYSKIVDASDRSAVAPLAEAFPGLGDPLKATWYFGHISNHVPGDFANTFGPYWLDAVIELQPQVTAKLVDASISPGAVDVRRDELVEDLRPLVPEGEGMSSSEISQLLISNTTDFDSSPEIAAGAVLYPEENILVLHSSLKADGAGPLLAAK